MLGIFDTRDVSRILYQSMLEAPSGSEERPPPFAGKSDAFERADPTHVGTPRGAPDPVKTSKRRLHRGAPKLRGRNSLNVQSCTQGIGGMFQGIIRSAVRLRGQIEITYHAHADFGVHHANTPTGSCGLVSWGSLTFRLSG